jgi:hypothetical protein
VTEHDPLPQAPGSQSKPVQRTEYVVLEKVEGDGWVEAKRVQATSSAAAVSKHVGDRDLADQDIAFVAVPVRSWQPVKPKTTTKTTTTLEAL